MKLFWNINRHPESYFGTLFIARSLQLLNVGMCISLMNLFFSLNYIYIFVEFYKFLVELYIFSLNFIKFSLICIFFFVELYFSLNFAKYGQPYQGDYVIDEGCF